MYIQYLKINGFKKFNTFSIEFNKHINVLIGENEAGKSTILEAIDIVLNQRAFNSASSFDKYLNLDNVEAYIVNPTIENLPKITIELTFNDSTDMEAEYFNGLHSSFNPICKNGITFTYKFDESYRDLFETASKETSNEFLIPTDYYIAEWTTFSGRKYINRKAPIKNVLIDNSVRRNNFFDSYSKRIFNANLDLLKRQKLSHRFKNNLQNFIKDNNEDLIIKDYTLGLDENKTVLENLVDLKLEGISIQNKGKGKENLIKTEIALEVESDLIMLEEPENHLSYINTRKLITEIQKMHKHAQIILTTHNPLIVSRLNLKNTLWITNRECYSLKGINEETATYFMKTDNMQLLNFILSHKVIVVEGNSEYILLPFLTKNSLQYSLEDKSIEILSGGGITYKHYIEVSKIIGNHLLVITDNDNNQNTIDDIQKLNAEFDIKHQNILIECPLSIDEFTFEVCLYNKNQSILNNISNKKSNTRPEYKGKQIDKNLAYMLKNKTEAALRITSEEQYSKTLLPSYILEGIEWLVQK